MAVSTCTVSVRVRRCGAVLLGALLGLTRPALPADLPGYVATSDRIVIARTAYLVEAVPGEITWRAATRLDITGPGLERLTATVPPDLQITRVAGDGLASWKSQNSGGRRPKQTLELHFDEPLRRNREIVFKGLLAHAPDQPWSVPPLVLDGIDAHVGRARLMCAKHCELSLEDLDGARPVIDESENSGIVFDLWQEDFRLECTTREKDRSAQADLLTRLTVAEDRLELNAVAEIQPLFAPLFELQVVIPSGWQVSAARLDGRLVSWHLLAERDGVCDLRIPLAEPIPSARTAKLELRASLTLPEGSDPSREVPLPEVRLPQAARVRGRYVIDRPQGTEVELVRGAGLRSVAEHEFGEASCYEHDARPIVGALRIAPRPVSEPLASQVPATAPDEAIATAGAEPLAPPATVARHVHVFSEFDAAGRSRHRADYVVPSETTSLLVRLPESAQLCQVVADDKPLAVRQQSGSVELRLPTSADQTGRTISIVYQHEHLPLSDSGTLQLEPLSVRAVDRRGHESELEVLEQHWSIQAPTGVLLYESRGAFRPVQTLASSGWLAAGLQAVSSPARAIWAGLLVVAVVSIARFRARRKPWRIVATAALVIGALALLASARPVLGNAASQQQSLGRSAKPKGGETLFRAILPAADVPLSVRYVTRTHSITARCAGAACAVFVLWLLRRRGPTFRALLAAAGLAAPLAALSFVDAAQHAWLDGIVLGTLAGILLGQVRPFTAPRLKASHALTRSAAALLVVGAMTGSSRGDEPPRAVRAESTFAVQIADEGVHFRGQYDLHSLSGSLGAFSFALPENVRVRNVTGANIAGWDVERDVDPAQLVVRFDGSASKSADVTVELFQPMPFPEGTTNWDLPPFHPRHLTSHRGTVSVRHPDHLTVVVANAEGLRRIDRSPRSDKLPACHSQPCPTEASWQLASTGAQTSLAWALTGGEVALALALDVTRPSRQCDVLAVHTAAVEPERLRLLSRFRVTHSGAPSLRFTAFVPEGCRLLDVRAPHLARWSFDDGLLTVWFDRPQSGSVDVELDIETQLQPEASGVEIAVPLPLDAARVRSLLGVQVDEALEPSIDPDALSGWMAADGEAESDEFTSCEDGPPLLRLANDSPEPLPVVVSLTPRNTARSARAEPIAAEEIAEPQPQAEDATPEALVETARLAIAIQDDGACRIEARYFVRSRGPRLLPILLPAGMQLLAADVDGRTATPVRPVDESSASILVPLAENAGALMEVRLLLEARLAAALPVDLRFFDRQRVDLPFPQIPTAEADPQYGLPVIRTVWNISVPNSLRAAAAPGEMRADQLIVEQSGSPALLRLTIGPASTAGPASLIAAIALVAGVWSIARRPRSPQVPAGSPAPKPEPPTIAALPHESGIFSARGRPIEAGRRPELH